MCLGIRGGHQFSKMYQLKGQRYDDFSGGKSSNKAIQSVKHERLIQRSNKKAKKYFLDGDEGTQLVSTCTIR
jgi:hypothetical protein